MVALDDGDGAVLKVPTLLRLVPCLQRKKYVVLAFSPVTFVCTVLSCDFAALRLLVFSRRPKVLLLGTSSVVLPLEVACAHRSADEGETSAAATPSEKPAAEAPAGKAAIRPRAARAARKRRIGCCLSWFEGNWQLLGLTRPRVTVTRLNT